jgi:hypothetical protein
VKSPDFFTEDYYIPLPEYKDDRHPTQFSVSTPSNDAILPTLTEYPETLKEMMFIVQKHRKQRLDIYQHLSGYGSNGRTLQLCH